MALISIDRFISRGNVRDSKVNKSDENYKILKANIKEIGLVQPITYRVDEKDNYVVIDGHQRLQIHKDLKLTEIKAYESNGEVDDLTKQLSTNMFRVPMTHLDASFTIDKMVEQGIVTTKKQLMKKFGKTGPWINVALAFCNIHPFIRNYFKQPEIKVTSKVQELLESISESPINTQEREIADEFNDYPSQEDFNQYIEDYSSYSSGPQENIEDFLDRLEYSVRGTEAHFKIICDVIGLETFREYETSHDVKAEYQNNLFKEYADSYFCEDNDFLWEVFTAETPIGHWLLQNETPIQEIESDEYIYFDFSNKVSTLKSKIKKSSGVPVKNVEITGVTGSVFNPRLSYNVLSEAIDEEPESYEGDNEDVEYEKSAKEQVVDPHFLKYNKFNKWAHPYITEHNLKSVDTLKTDPFGCNENFKWIMVELQIRPSFDVGWMLEDEEGHPLKKFLVDNSELYSNDDLIQHMATHWFNRYYEDADFGQIDKLLEIHEAVNCKEWLAEVFKTNKDARKDYLNIMKKDELVEIATEKHNVPDTDYGKLGKADLVEAVSDMEFDEIPLFHLVLTNEGSGANHIGSYR